MDKIVTAQAGNTAEASRIHHAARLSSSQIAQLERLKNYSTLYEVVLVSKTGEEYFVCYSRKSGRGLILVLQDYVKDIVGITGHVSLGTRKPSFMALGDSWFLKFTGRTQRECIMHGHAARLPEVAK